ncbi:MAG TPA: glycosyltransferase [Candidatus Saccharimonadales bacterium]|jgi:glycosyltransferase involved in cell wall biosynthesis|nr:glycosyltransferase [Candidatus Saccharimonadales bacterium]
MIANFEGSVPAPPAASYPGERWPLVSILIPVFRRVTFLCGAIESILAQNYPNKEVIVLEDGSREAEDVIRQFGDDVRYIWQPNQGVAAARNTAAQAARGAWIALLDEDDIWLPEKLMRQMELVSRFPSLGVVHTNYFWLRSDTPEERPFPLVASVPSGWVTRELFLERFSLLPSSAVIRKDYFHRVGGFNPAYRLVDDYDFWLRLSHHCQFGYLATPLTLYRVDSQGGSSDRQRTALENVAIRHAFLRANPELCRTWPRHLVNNALHRVHLTCARRHLWADDIATARAHFFKAWTWKPSHLGSLVYGLACLAGPIAVRPLRAIMRYLRRSAAIETATGHAADESTRAEPRRQ